jgi:uncharacterized membrane protein YgcG
MAKFIILFFLITGGLVSYFTYQGTGQERVETLDKEKSYRSGSSSGGSYGSGGYSYGK